MTDLDHVSNVVPLEVLRAVGLNPADPMHQAALLACEKYDLDPLLRHIVVIPKSPPYITRDGRLHIAHRDGRFDGMEVLEESETATHWRAKVAVYRKDMSHPFAYVGRYPKAGSNKVYGPEMAVKTAEVAALRRAFPVGGMASYEERWDLDTPDLSEAPRSYRHERAEMELADLEPLPADPGLTKRIHAEIRDLNPALSPVQVDEIRHALVVVVTRHRDGGPITSSNDLDYAEQLALSEILARARAGTATITRTDTGFEIRTEKHLYEVDVEEGHVGVSVSQLPVVEEDGGQLELGQE